VTLASIARPTTPDFMARLNTATYDALPQRSRHPRGAAHARPDARDGNRAGRILRRSGSAAGAPSRGDGRGRLLRRHARIRARPARAGRQAGGRNRGQPGARLGHPPRQHSAARSQNRRAYGADGWPPDHRNAHGRGLGRLRKVHGARGCRRARHSRLRSAGAQPSCGVDAMASFPGSARLEPYAGPRPAVRR